MTERRNGGASSVSLRPLLRILCENIADFVAEDFQDFAKARETFEVLVHDAGAAVEGAETSIERLKSITDWFGFYQALAGHDLLSGDFDVSEFLDVWDRIWGYDVNGILEVGARTPAKADDRGILMPHLLGAHFLASAAPSSVQIRDQVGTLKDNHVHFGQLVELGLLWHGQLRSKSCTWVGYRPTMSEGADSFAETKRRREFESIADPDPAPLKHGLRQTFDWASLLARCRLLLFYFERNADRSGVWGSDEPSRFLHAVIDANQRMRGTTPERSGGTNGDRLAELEIGHSTLFETARRSGVEESIISERRMLGMLRHAGDGTSTEARQQAAFAAAYLALKNTAISRVSSQSVHRFEKRFEAFTRSLAVLQNIYDQDVSLFAKDSSFISALRKNIVRSRSFVSDVRYALRPNKLKLGASTRPIGLQWKTAAKAGEDENVGIVLAFHRRDLIDFENRGKAAFNSICDIIVRLEREGHCNVVGVDLIGSEVAFDGTEMYSSTEFLFESVDFILKFRNDLSERLGRRLFVTIHLGEHVCERALGILTFAAIMTDPRLDPCLDRFGHALILPDANLGWADPRADVATSREAALGKLMMNCPKNTGHLFDKSRAELLKTAAATLVEDPDHVQSFDTVRGILLDVIERGQFAVEVCPYSNKMIRKVDPRRHPWGKSISKARLLIGTDDPSLTQTQPWIEATAFYYAHIAAT